MFVCACMYCVDSVPCRMSYNASVCLSVHVCVCACEGVCVCVCVRVCVSLEPTDRGIKYSKVAAQRGTFVMSDCGRICFPAEKRSQFELQQTDFLLPRYSREKNGCNYHFVVTVQFYGWTTL